MSKKIEENKAAEIVDVNIAEGTISTSKSSARKNKDVAILPTDILDEPYDGINHHVNKSVYKEHEKQNLVIPDVVQQNHNKSNKNIFVIIVFLIIGLFLAGAIFLLVMLRPSTTNEVPERPVNIQKDHPPIVISTPQPSNIHYFENHLIPINMNNWLLVPYHTWNERSNYESLRNQAIQWSRNVQDFQVNVSTMHALEHGFSNRDEDMWIYAEEIDDYVLNLGYQYILREDVEYYFATYLHRLINPIFGGWHNYQALQYIQSLAGDEFIDLIDNNNEDLYSMGIFIDKDVEFSEWGSWQGSLVRLKNVFLPDLWDSFNDDFHNSLPVISSITNISSYIETKISYNSENNMLSLPDDTDTFLIGFFGVPQVDKIKVEKILHESGNYLWNFIVPVIYRTFTEEGIIKSLNGELFFQLVPYFTDNPDFYNPRLRISYSSLIINGREIQNGHIKGRLDNIANDFDSSNIDRSIFIGKWEDNAINTIVEIYEDNRMIWKYNDGTEEISYWDFISTETIQICSINSENEVDYSVCGKWIFVIEENEIIFTLIENPEIAFTLSR
ncbi:MAG: hypothetical protein LBD23_16210 [Oscillospiraceae bacterium]|nr:hypothetical protein [Oscillospiraceae bacterium]